MNGPYIDYAYIAAMDDIQKSFAMQEQKNLLSLQNKGLLYEDFLGNISLAPESEPFRPIFFGNREGRLEICGPAGMVKLVDLRLHIMEDDIAVTSISEKMITVWSVKSSELLDLIRRILNLPNSSNALNDEEIAIDDAFRVIVASSGSDDGSSSVKVWYEKDDNLLEKTDSSLCHAVLPETVSKTIVELFIKGGN